MKAIVQDGYGSADVLQLREIERPILTDDLVLVRVRAASVNALDWHAVHGGRLVGVIGFLLRQKSILVRGADEAIAIAKRWPTGGMVEVRPVAE